MREITGGEDARLVAAPARHAGVLADETRSGARLDLKCVHRTDVKAFGGRTLQARLLMELPSVGIRGLDQRVDLDFRVVEDPDAWHVREADALVLLRADDLAGQAADAERWVGEDDALGEFRRARSGRARDCRAAEGLERHEGDDRCRSAQKVASRDVRAGGLFALVIRA
ncbi:MAG: hypothetical protein M3O80_08805 [Chloroflexota bacterium]|nr:hypothetical protein [Chloroflexota bacterium]